MNRRLYVFVLLLPLLPILGILGPFVFNTYDSNFLQLATPLFCGLVATLLVFLCDESNRMIYSVAVFAITLAMVLRTVLVSPYLVGFDINGESYFVNSVVAGSRWDATIAATYNSVLSVNILAPIIQLVSGMSVLQILKVIYPLILSASSLVLFLAFRWVSNNKTAFLASLLVSSIYSFHNELVGVGKQMIAQYLFASLLFVICAQSASSLRSVRGSALFVLLSFGLVVSHYGLSSYLLLYFFISLPALIFLSRKRDSTVFLKPIIILLYAVEIVAWYLFTAGGVTFDTFLTIGSYVFYSLSQILNTTSVEPLRIAGSATSIWRLGTVVINAGEILLSIGGLFYVLLRFKKWQFNWDYLLISLGTSLVATISVTFPGFNPLGIGRLQVLILTTLALFSTIGILAVVRAAQLTLRRLAKSDRPMKSGYEMSLKLQSLMILALILFNSGVVYQLAGDKPFSLNLDKNAISASFTVQDQLASNWLVDSVDPSQYWHIKADLFASVSFYQYGPALINHGIELENHNGSLQVEPIHREDIVYLASFNINNGVINPYLPEAGTPKAQWETPQISLGLLGLAVKDRIYDSESVNIFAEGN